ncbi:unnamed protein product [Prorocentrum cordatum]|uniref:HECT-type E3 ubiquitin transferase n=1 Tax=Prorocentrum cordatum TaxID=2364126 RepID=A0ABN9T2I9_9DINO|nr:unnamed protein product [Polarella glacialis]
MPEHLDPFWGSVGAALAAPRVVANALVDGGLPGLDAAGLNGAWRPLLFGCLFYWTLARVLIMQVVIPMRYARAQVYGQIQQSLSGLSAFRLNVVYVLGNILMLIFSFLILAPIAVLDSWLKTWPLMLPVWLYLHNCIWTLGEYLSSSETGPAPKPHQWLGLVTLAWFLLALACERPRVPFFAEDFDHEEMFKQVMKKGPFQAQMEEQHGLLARSVSFTARPLMRRLSTLLNVDAQDVERKREVLRCGSIESHGGKVGDMYNLGPVVREDLLKSSLQFLQTASVAQLLSKHFTVRFQGEDAIDAGGVTKDWFDSLARELASGSEQHERRRSIDDFFSSSLLACAPDGTLLPRPSGCLGADCSEAQREQLRARWTQLAAVGRFLGVAVLERRPLPLSFGQVLMKLLCEKAVSYSDVRHLDNDFYRHRIIGLLQEGGVERASAALGEPLTFTSAPTDLMPDTVPLKEGGGEILVTEENKMEYIGLLSEARICAGRRHELQFFVSGFHEVIPVGVLKQAAVGPAELSLLISGVHEYDVAEWRSCAKETGDEIVLGWFWEVVASFTEEQRALLLNFSTGSSRIPPGGFRDMSPQFQVQVLATDENQDRLPSAHTCFNQLDLPRYSSRELLAEKLALAISQPARFGLA